MSVTGLDHGQIAAVAREITRYFDHGWQIKWDRRPDGTDALCFAHPARGTFRINATVIAEGFWVRQLLGVLSLLDATPGLVVEALDDGSMVARLLPAPADEPPAPAAPRHPAQPGITARRAPGFV